MASGFLRRAGRRFGAAHRLSEGRCHLPLIPPPASRPRSAAAAPPSRTAGSRPRRAARPSPRPPDRRADRPGRSPARRRAAAARGITRCSPGGRAGMPTTLAPGGTSATTTALAPIRAPAPTVIGPSTCAPGADRHAVAHRRMALARLPPGLEGEPAQGDAVVDQHVVADLRRFADHHAHAVVDEEPPADPGAGMDLDAGDEAAGVRDHARRGPQAEAVERVRHAMRSAPHAPRHSRSAPPSQVGRAGSRTRMVRASSNSSIYASPSRRRCGLRYAANQEGTGRFRSRRNSGLNSLL